MIGSPAYRVFDRLLQQADALSQAAHENDSKTNSIESSIYRRCGYLLTAAALDTYFHERGIKLLANYANSSEASAQAVAKYLRRKSVSDVWGEGAEAKVRLSLSYKTLVSSTAISELSENAGMDVPSFWLFVAEKNMTQPKRLQMQLDLAYERRNQIAHEGDWDAAKLEFRTVTANHLQECRDIVFSVASSFEEYSKQML